MAPPGFRRRGRVKSLGPRLRGDEAGKPDRWRTRESPLKTRSFHLKADWHYELSGQRQHYVLEAFVEQAFGGRAYGWFQPGAQFVLEKIEVTAALRSKGYGTLLIEELRSKAREVGCAELVIQGVRAGNRRAIKLYESLGAVALPASDGLCDFVFSPP